ncbi:MAG: hypothetical protein Q4G68_02665 [Planctomycetia bacterium]|nr:hypothetical protein [Planctomycetia bacterium]
MRGFSNGGMIREQAERRTFLTNSRLHNAEAALETSPTKAAATGRPHPLLCSAAFLLSVLILLLANSKSLPAQIQADSHATVPPTGVPDETFWQTTIQEPWSHVPGDPVREAILQEAHARWLAWRPLAALQPERRDATKVRILTDRHVTIYTDLPSTPATDELPHVFELALTQILDYFKLTPADYETWKIEVLLVRDSNLFSNWGALSGLPGPTPGFSNGSRIWVFDQQFDYYNRLLLIHELVHAVMNRSFGALEPRWFAEGIAESLALHHWDGTKLELGQKPSRLYQTPGFARLDTLNRLRYDDALPDLATVFALTPDDFRGTKAYAIAWSFVLFLTQHERYKDLAARMPYFMMAPNPTGQFLRLVEEANLPLAADWSDFILNFTEDYDFEKAQVDYTPGTLLAVGDSRTISVSPQTGWVNSGLILESGGEYQLKPQGSFELYDPRKMVPCDANGITKTWHAGRPTGMMLFCLGNGSPASSDYWRDTEPLRRTKRLTPAQTGSLFLRLNVPCFDLAKNRGSIDVEVQRVK